MPILSKLTKESFHNEAAAFGYLEATLWPDGPVCPHCGTVGNATKLQVDGGVRAGKRQARIGLWKCKEKACRKQFTVKVGTVFEHGRIPLHKMLQAVYLLCCSKKGCSAHQLHRVLGITYKAAWFLAHRIREAMRNDSTGPLGGSGKIVEADETFFVNKKDVPKKSGGAGHKIVVVSLVERGGPIKSVVIDAVSRWEISRIIREGVDRESRLMTDSAGYYKSGFNVAEHQMVDHSVGEYVRGDVHTNTLEGYYSIFKRGMKGIYQHCSEQHLHRYVAEFDFRYNNRIALGVDDAARTTKALQGIGGKRLTYRNPNVTAAE